MTSCTVRSKCPPAWDSLIRVPSRSHVRIRRGLDEATVRGGSQRLWYLWQELSCKRLSARRSVEQESAIDSLVIVRANFTTLEPYSRLVSKPRYPGFGRQNLTGLLAPILADSSWRLNTVSSGLANAPYVLQRSQDRSRRHSLDFVPMHMFYATRTLAILVR